MNPFRMRLYDIRNSLHFLQPGVGLTNHVVVYRLFFSCFLKENTVSRLAQGEICGTIELCEKAISALIPLTSRQEWITCMLYMRHSMTQADMLER